MNALRTLDAIIVVYRRGAPSTPSGDSRWHFAPRSG